MEQSAQDPPVEIRVEPPPQPAEVRGLPCPYCKVVGQNYVVKTMANKMRKRICIACRASFVTKETAF
jgi:hypothetical protein